MRATRKLGIFLKPYWHWAVLAPLLMALEVAMDLMQPRLIQHIVDQGIARSDMAVVINTGLWMIGLALIGLGGGIGCGVFAIMAGQHFGADLRATLFRKVQALSFGNLDHLETGKLITRLTNDVTQVQEVVMMLLRIMVRVPLLLVGSLIMAILTSPQLALLFLVLIPFVVVVLVFIINRTFPLFKEVQQQLDALNTVLQENLAGVRVVIAFARGQHETERFRRINDRLMDRNVTAVRITAVTMPIMMLLLNFGVVGALWIGGMEINTGGLQVGQLIAFINYLTQTLMSLMMISMLLVRVSRAEASAVRIQEVLDSEPEVRNRPDALSTFAPRGRVAFEDVGFSYNGDDHDPVLRNISFVAEPGQTVALLGATGSGKSSLVNLIPRFYDATHGRVTIDGVDVRAIDEAALHSAVGVAMQESILFTGTIRDNIRYGRPEATDEEVVAAARMAQAHVFITRFPDGYDSVVGQRGVNLSGGQKQRIAIARALLARPAVLILDDSTSAVDVETEARIQAALASLDHAQTRFVVAQRISTVQEADKILVLDDGRIVAEGTHDDLLEASPIYREIYESQMEY
ncbi:MAG: ABC transporter ATP-binding protein/permease [Chloroflexota bacterium]|nr:ABC transporter ATP-binding protein/permease [Chloroflexota bacterium]